MINGIPAMTIKLESEDVVFVENELHALIVYKLDGEDPSLKVTGLKNILAIRDLLNDAYPVSNCKGAAHVEHHLKHAIHKLKKMQEETTNVSIGAALERAGWFFGHEFQSVLDDLDTALALAEQKNDPAGEQSHLGR